MKKSGNGIVVLCLFFLVLCFAMYFIGYDSGKKHEYEIGYSVGSWTTALHYNCKGNYGSQYFHDLVIVSGEAPQTCADIDSIYAGRLVVP